MPQTEVIFFQDDSGRSPAFDWLASVRKKQPKAFAKCAALLKRLEQSGHELVFPAASILHSGIYELRAHDGTVQYRILYFFDRRKKNAAVVVLGFVKESKRQQDTEIDRACRCKTAFEDNPDAHTFETN